MPQVNAESPKLPYEAPALVRVGSFEDVTRDLAAMELLGEAMVVDWSNGRVS